MRELFHRTSNCEFEELSQTEAMRVAHYLASIVEQVHARQDGQCNSSILAGGSLTDQHEVDGYAALAVT